MCDKCGETTKTTYKLTDLIYVCGNCYMIEKDEWIKC